MNIPGCHGKFPLVLRATQPRAGSAGLSWPGLSRHSSPVPVPAVPPPAVPSSGRGSGIPRLPVPVPVPVPCPRRGRHRAVPSGAAGPGTAGAGRAPPGAHIWRQPGQGVPPDVSPARSRRHRAGEGLRRSSAGPGALPALPTGGGTAAPDSARGAETFAGGGLPRVPGGHPSINPSIPPWRDSLPGAQPLVPPAPAAPGAPLPLPPTFLPPPPLSRQEGRGSAAPPRCRPRRSAASCGRAAPSAPRSSAARPGCITPLL